MTHSQERKLKRLLKEMHKKIEYAFNYVPMQGFYGQSIIDLLEISKLKEIVNHHSEWRTYKITYK